MATIKVHAFNIGNGNVDFYLTAMTAKEIFQFSKVSRVDEDPNVGYQRFLSEKRATAIAEYIDAGNILPGAIVLSAQENAQLSFKDDILSINLEAGSFFVIDGQHRLYGSEKAANEIRLPVCILDGLDHREEVQYFLDINSTQKGVPKTLRIELMKFLSEPDSIDAIRNRLFKDLNESPESPLYDRMSATSSGPGRLSLVPFQAAVDPLLTGDILGQFTYEDKKRLLINYLSAVERVLDKVDGKSGRLVTSAFFQAVFKVFDKVCHLSIMHCKNYSTDAMTQILDGISSVDMDRHSGSNQQAINELAAELSTLLEIHSQRLGTPAGLL
ncbi:DGQHR domain-containing protein [Janthinobacterium sp. PC23-8]|uniref:DGQHR domain-containing protein n=1 Tax=Janthinobacterium sp. PC23-8 TaxID=2012679 RepID=UPI000B96BA18|nr:DGQHR domain-containing protein [Janthinobacterium sp. PC23-8]OYO28556.1 hypothetical protein CD932_15315 [Janthinobacterium sp. PC23-8]